MERNGCVDFELGSTMRSDGGEYKIVRRLGQPGDEGDVYQATYRDLLDCAIKFVDPEQVKESMIETEVRLLALLRHTHLVRITSFAMGMPTPPVSQPKLMRKPWFYIVMEFVPGEPIDQTWRGIEGPDLLRLLDQLLDAVVYLHHRGVLHMDLKPKNILVEKGSHNVVLIDLGFSVVADPERFQEWFALEGERMRSIVESDNVYVASTREYTRPEQHNLLGTMVNRELIRDEWFPHHDLWALGRLIKEALNGATLQQWPTIREGLDLVADRLLAGGHYTGAPEVRADIQKLRPGYLAPLGLPELSILVEAGTVATLSRATVQLTERVLVLVEHPFFQRLRLIPQLEFAYLLYSDARHSRLAHSLLTFHLTRLALAHMLVDVHFRLAVDTADMEGALLFALLHDIGQYPLSHMFEDFKGRQTATDDLVRTDEDLFQPIVLGGGEDQIGKVVGDLLGQEPTLAACIHDRFGSNALDAMTSIASCVIEGTPPKKAMHRVLAGLMSSAIDIDKVSYLVADSTMSGVPYGCGIDVERLLMSLAAPPSIYTPAEASTAAPPSIDIPVEAPAGIPVIGIKAKGLAAAESVILARYWMLSRVYWHHTNRAVMAGFKFVISELIARGQLRFSSYFGDTFWETEIEALKRLSSAFGPLARKGELVNPLEGFIGGRRDMYRRLVVISRAVDADLHTKLVSAEDALPPETVTQALRQFLSAGELKRGSVLVDVPKRSRDIISPERICVLRDSEIGEEPKEEGLDTVSPLVKRMTEEFLNEVKKCRVLVSCRVYEILEKDNKLKQAREAVLSALGSKLQ